MKKVSLEIEKAAAPPSRGGLFSIGASKRHEEADAQPDVYHQPRALRFLADALAKFPPMELARLDSNRKRERYAARMTRACAWTGTTRVS